MPRPIPDIMPDTLAGWNQMCEDILFNAQEAFDLACNEARENAATAFDAEAPARRQALLDQAKAQIDAQLDQEGQPLADSEKVALLAEAAKQIDAELARQREEAVNNSIIGIEQPQTLEQIKTTYVYGKPQKRQPEPETCPRPDPAHAVYRLADGRLYDVEAQEFIQARAAVEESRIIDLPEPGTNDYLKFVLQFYILPIPACLLNQEELFARLRAERDKRIAATDYLLTADYPISADKREAITNYRTALRDLPAQAGAPWDGGGPETPWPGLEA